jgi:hypothetical protein
LISKGPDAGLVRRFWAANSPTIIMVVKEMANAMTVLLDTSLSGMNLAADSTPGHQPRYLRVKVRRFILPHHITFHFRMAAY